MSKEEQIKKLEERLEEMENNWKRALADYQNLQKRVIEEKEQMAIFAKETVIRHLIPSLDNFEMAKKHCEDKGFDMAIKEFFKILKELGVEEVETESKDFDAETMEAVESVEGEKNKVIEVLRKGYFLDGKLIRPARVNVGKGKEE